VSIVRTDNCLKLFIRNLSAPAEFCLVLLIGFGLFIIVQIWNVVHSEHAEINNFGMTACVIIELLVLVPVLWIGRIRGWSLGTFGLKISWKGTGAGILLFIFAEAAMSGSGMLMQLIHPVQPRYVVTGATVPFILLLSLINPVFEEVLEAGYIIHSLQRFGIWPAILAGAVFRAFYHLWYGVNTALCLFAFAVVFGIAYWRWRQLWPLIVAHALSDFVGLMYWSHHHAA